MARAGLSFASKCEVFRIMPVLCATILMEAGYASSLIVTRLSDPPAFDDLIEAGTVPAGMTRISGFVQRLPQDGHPATRDTVVYLGYDAEYLYVVFNAYDDPAQVRANLSRREDIENDDRVSVTLDTFGDQRRAYVFEANPLGVQRDLTFVEGQGFDPTFDTVWSSTGAITSWGYVVLMKLPFRSLRFTPGGSTPWRVFFERTVQRYSGEISTWPHISTGVDGRLNQAATLDGIEGVAPGRNLQFIPHATLRSFRGIDDGGTPAFIEERFDPEIGIDIKKVWDDRIIADLTINPDFSQIESDEPQVTVNQRFEVFFPERRPFFLENADFFNTPIDLLFTRRIADPSYGGRLTARLGPWSLGSLVTNDEAPPELPGSGATGDRDDAHFAGARISRDVGAQSRVGAMFVQRSFAGDRNRVAGIDGRIKWNDRWASSIQVAASRTAQRGRPHVSGDAAFLDVTRSGRHFNYVAEIVSISEDFEAQAGFVPRTGVVGMTHFASLFLWPGGGGPLVRWGPEFLVSKVWDRNGRRLDEAFEVSLEWEFPGQTNFEINVNRSRERLTVAEFPALGSDRDFDTDFINVEYDTALWRTFSIEGDTSIGKRINFSPPAPGAPVPTDWLQSNLGISYRPLAPLNVDAGVIFSRLETEAGGDLVLEDLILRTRVNWQFTRDWSLRVIVQHERTTPNPLHSQVPDRRNWNGDFLLTWRRNPWTTLFLGYNQNRQNVVIDELNGRTELVRTDGLHTDSEQIILKVSYLFRR